MIRAGIHRQSAKGMVGGAKQGTESVVLNGGYVDDLDYGDEVIYTGEGVAELAGDRSGNQTWTGANEGMRVNLAHGLPVRLIRGARGDPALSPATGYRYDGLYVVEEAWQERGIDGFVICRFRLRSGDWTPLRDPPDCASSGMVAGISTPTVWAA